MKPVLVFSLIPLAAGLHVALATKFGIYDRRTIIPLLIMLPAVAGLAWMLRVDPQRSLWVLNITAWLLVAGFVWWTQIYSTYEPGTAVSDGSNILAMTQDLGMVDWQGADVDLPAMLDENTASLLVFYRGYW